MALHRSADAAPFPGLAAARYNARGMSAPATDRLPANPRRTRDLILLVCSLVAGVLAVIYRHQGFDLGLVLLSVALFWLAVLDSARSGPRRAPLLVFAASAMLIGIGVIVIVAAV